MPKVSAVMALYNTPYHYLEETVKSILSQTLSDFELIIVDDASTIEYRRFFERFKDERIKYFKLEENSGPGHARNEGIKKAVGEFIAITDSDDIYMSQKFELQVKFLNENPDISLVGCTFRFSNREKLSFVPLSNKDIKTFMLFNSPLTNPTIMFRREEFIKKNLFYSEDINFAEDYELWIDAMFAGVKMVNLEEFLMIYTRRPSQLSKTKLQKQIEILKKLYKKMFLLLGFEASEEELDLHYDVYTEKFKKIKNSEQISGWFDKIIEYNKKQKIFDENCIIDKKIAVLDKYHRIKNRLFKVKIGQKNLCLSKKLKIY
ncbi:MAG: glycosyltransferase [Candidatus Gastranaerophilales bacterium]|nr:glycosyltransferase [Candidatus Gastranaerophilales bacterium]